MVWPMPCAVNYLEFPVYQISSKGKPREDVTSMKGRVGLRYMVLDGGFNSSWGSQGREHTGRACLKKQTHVGLKSCQDSEKSQGSM